jgi:hypothetical protein
MKIYFDENFSPHFIRGLSHIQRAHPNHGIEVKSIKEVFGGGTPDEEWIPKIAQQHGVVVTQDLKIRRLRHQWELCSKYKLGLFFIKPPKNGWSYWAIVKRIINFWQQIQSISLRERKPFAYILSATKSKLEKLNNK